MSLPLALLPLVLVCQAGGDPLAAGFESWFRRYRAGEARYDARVLNPMIARGRDDDIRRLFEVLEHRFPPDHEARREAERVQATLLGALGSPTAAKTVREAVFDRLLAGVRVVSPEGVEPAWNHDEPSLAALLIPVIGRFERQRLVPALECFCRGSQPAMILAAAEQLMRSGAGQSFLTIGRGIRWLSEAAHVRDIGRYLASMCDTHEVPQPRVDYVIDIALRRLASHEDAAVKTRFLPMLLELRSKRSVPALIAELEHTWDVLNGHDPYPTSLSFYLWSVHDALQELTGLREPASRPDRWRDVWNTLGSRLELQPKQRVDVASSADGFFGLPVMGRRVLFVIDSSRHMAGPPDELTKKTKLERAREALLRAVSGLDPESLFTVVLYNELARSLAPALVRPKPERVKALGRMLEGAAARGEPRLREALRAGLEGRVRRMQTKQLIGIDEVFVLCAGCPDDEPASILRDVADWNVGRAARIHAVLLSDDRKNQQHQESCAEFLQRLVRDNNGELRIR